VLYRHNVSDRRSPEGEHEPDEEMNSIIPLPGTRVRCLAMNDPQAVPAGTLGTVTDITNMGAWVRIGVRWDNGSRLALAVPPDRYEPE
jgi:uncharacterized protein DUF4314